MATLADIASGGAFEKTAKSKGIAKVRDLVEFAKVSPENRQKAIDSLPGYSVVYEPLVGSPQVLHISNKRDAAYFLDANSRDDAPRGNLNSRFVRGDVTSLKKDFDYAPLELKSKPTGFGPWLSDNWKGVALAGAGAAGLAAYAIYNNIKKRREQKRREEEQRRMLAEASGEKTAEASEALMDFASRLSSAVAASAASGGIGLQIADRIAARRGKLP